MRYRESGGRFDEGSLGHHASLAQDIAALGKDSRMGDLIRPRRKTLRFSDRDIRRVPCLE
jgi:hypothetical protein